MLIADNLDQLLEILPEFITISLKNGEKRFELIEIVLDVGRRPEARFAKNVNYLSYRTIVWQDLEYILKRLGKFSGDNRAGIEKTLHRISALRNRQGGVTGLTCRLGRAILGTVGIVSDLLAKQKSILILGRPGVGKTTAIREIARLLSDDMKKRVIIIDTSNEIAGDGDLPHPSIGKARRMQVSNPQNQHQVMIEAVENHMPEIIIIDEIGNELETSAARTIAERGVQLVGTAHGGSLDNIIKNPVMMDLVGGVQYVTLGDEEARRRGSSKSILERKAPSTFDLAIEIHDPRTWIIHENIEYSIDLLLQNSLIPLQRREVFPTKKNIIQSQICYFQKGENLSTLEISNKRNLLEKKQKPSFTKNNSSSVEPLKIKKSNKLSLLSKKQLNNQFIFLYVYGINNQDLRAIIKLWNLPIIVTREIQYADAILALGNLIKNNKKLRQISTSQNLNIYAIQNSSLSQLFNALKQISNQGDNNQINEKQDVVKQVGLKLLTPFEEVRLIIEEISLTKKCKVDLLPQSGSVRRLQHEIINHYNLKSLSLGREPYRRVRIYP